MRRTLIFFDFQTRGLISCIAIFLPAILSAQISVGIIYSNVSCYGACNGSATAIITNGTAPYQYEWSNGSVAPFIGNLCPGVYTVTVTDANQESDVDSVVITQPFAPLGVEIQVQNQICDIAPDGTATANPLGGTPPYTYLWNTDSTTQQITGLAAGVYSVTITDINGCTASDQDTVLFWNEGIWLMDSTVNVLCYGENTGFSHIGPMSGTPPYTYTWSNDSTTQDISNLYAGTYTVTVVDANGCSNSATVNVTQPDSLDISVITSPAACGDPGSATVIPTGGVPPYTIEWSNDSTGLSVNAPAGQISVTITDANGCTFVAGITIPGNNDSLTITGQILGNAGCLILGSATVNVTGGSGDYSYAWSTGDISSTLVNLPATTVTVTVTDNMSGCTGTTSVTIPMAPELVADANISSQATCLTGGSAAVVVTGGTPPYLITWSNGDSTTMVSGLEPGQVIVNVTDSTGCTASDTIMITLPDPPEGSVQVDTLANCLGGGGALTANGTGGTPPYSFEWNTGDVTQTLSGLSAGAYTVIVTDSLGCADTVSVNLGTKPGPDISFNFIAPASCTTPTATVEVVATGGTPPYTSYLWNFGADTSMITLIPGVYTVTVTDAAGCTSTNSVTITLPTAPEVAINVDSLANCSGGGGGATAVASGGTAPYGFVWNTGFAGPSLVNISAGTYIVIVTDSLGCIDTASITLGTKPAPTVSFDMLVEAVCYDPATVDAVATGGTAPYNYLWSTGATTSTTNLIAGTYTVTVTDAAGCTAVDSLTITQPPAPDITIQIDSLADCLTGSGGGATATVTGGVPPYTFLWSNGETTASAHNLSPGTYSVIVTDSTGCADTASVTIGTEPTALISFNILTAATCVTPATVEVVVSGGTPPFTIEWSTGDDTPIVELGAGTFTVTVTDSLGCPNIDSLTITLPPAPEIMVTVDSLANCSGGGGAATAIPNGGTPPYTFLWSTGDDTASVFNLSADTYTVVVTDSLGCTGSAKITIGLKPSPTISFDTIAQATCATPANIDAVASGGTAPYTYLWSTGANTSLTDLNEGTYTVTVIDAAGCTAVDSLTITLPPAPEVMVTVDTLANCSGGGGSATASATGGTAPYSFVWSTGDNTATASNLSEGTYTVIATDSLGCMDTTSVTIGLKPSPAISFNIVAPATCIAPASVDAVATGGTAPYTYLWSTGANTSLTDLNEGTYTVTVTDAAGCTAVDSLTITLPPAPEVMVTVDSLANCSGGGGSATASATGGTAPYTFVWSTGDNTATASNLSEGAYTVIATDSLGCMDTTSVTIGLKPSPAIAFNIVAPATCIAPASVDAIASGGTAPYTYLWSTGANTSLTSLNEGTYTVTVTDAAGCTAIDSLTITLPPAPEVMVTVDSLANCSGGGGSATASATGGTAPYTFVWSTGDNTATASNLSEGAYTVIATDSLGCMDTTSVTIGLKPSPTISFNIVAPATCIAPASVDAVASGGTAPYTYLWSTGANTSLTSLNEGTYTVTVTDAAGCTAIDSLTITLPPAPEVMVTVDSLANCSGGGGVATASATGGTAPYTFAWSTGDNTATASNLSEGAYTVIATDSLGCMDTTSVTIGLKPSPTISFNIVAPATCIAPASVDAVASGGTAPYTYLWSTGANTSLTGLNEGAYTVTVTDAAGCTAVDSLTITLPPAPEVTAVVDSLANCTMGGGGATATATGGAQPYSFAWSNGDNTASALNLSAGTYTVIVTDSLGCADTTSVNVGQASPPTVSLAVTAAATCIAPGAAEATPAGGTAPYTFLWSDGTTTSVNGSLPPGTYTVTVTDKKECTAVGQVTVDAPPMPMVSIIDSMDIGCNIQGSATAASFSGTPPYTYIWDTGSTDSMATNLTAGTHTVTLTDANGCTDIATVNIDSTGNNGINIGDFVWNDLDQNGFQHLLEPGVPNFPVLLIAPGPDGQFGNADDIIMDSSVTDANGKYGFNCVAPGTYIVKFAGLPAGYEFTAKDAVNNDCKDSDANANGITAPITVVPGQADNICVDAGIHVFCENVMNAGIICCNQTICEGDIPDELFEVQPPLMGTGPLEYLWMQLVQVGQAPPNWMAIPGATSATYQPPALFQTSYFMRCVRRQGCVTYLETNIITITVLPAGTGGCGSFMGDFIVSAVGNATVKVQWTTLPEKTSYMYTVERSVDKTTWVTVEQMMGYQDPVALNHYTVMDHSPANGMNYYRIRRQSAGGPESVSDIRQIELNITMEESLAVYPNPASEILNIRNLMVYDADARVEMFTTSGARLHEMKIPAGTLQQFEVPVADLPQGIYLVRIRFGDSEVKTLKVSKM